MQTILILTPTWTCKLKVNNAYKITNICDIFREFLDKPLENFIALVDKQTGGDYTIIQRKCWECSTCTFPYCKKDEGKL
jgi:hypothetical protein